MRRSDKKIITMRGMAELASRGLIRCLRLHEVGGSENIVGLPFRHFKKEVKMNADFISFVMQMIIIFLLLLVLALKT